MVKTKTSSDVLLFAGQGSSAHLTTQTFIDLDNKPPKLKALLDDFLQKCLTAFYAEFDALADDEKKIVGTGAKKDIDKPEALLTPPPLYQGSAVFESVTLYLHQLVDLILYKFQNGIEAVIETAGVCSGMLPAILAASFPSSISSQFIEYAVDGFRLAFWIGLRTSLFCHQASPDDSHQPWALTVRGCSVEKLQDRVDEYNKNSSSKLPIRVSGIFAEDLVSLVGDSNTLEEFKSKALQPAVSARYPHVHGYYHGGMAMEQVVQELIRDAQRREIKFPTWQLIDIPVRSTVTGKILESTRSLLEIALTHMLVDTADWKKTWEYLHATTLTVSSAEKVRVILLGPGTGSLRLASRSSQLRPNVEVISNPPSQDLPNNSDDIAIVGMSVNYPPGKGTTEFWTSLKDGISTVSEIPYTRFDNSQYFRNEESAFRSMKVKHGNFLQDPFAFDNSFFNISPREAKSMDPQQRLLLHASLEALEDAGYAPNTTYTFQKDSFGVYIGVATGDYVDNLRGHPDIYYSPGTLRAFLSGRISYTFGFLGPSMVIDTACSSSLVAIYQACRALQSDECTAALAGGVNVVSSPDMYLGLARAHFLSETGQCKPFDAAADGYCRSEGCGVVVLKRLSQAIAEDDRILGVIRGIEINQCGRSKSITHPDSSTQAALFRKLLKRSGISPNMVSVVEAHGTGTQAGDYAETSSLGAVFGPARTPDNPLYISSVKGTIGHAEAASGAAGLAKLLMMMKHKQIPHQASLNNLNPRLNIPANFIIPRQLSEWILPPGSRRVALLNNFGAAGSNVALLLEEFPVQQHDCHTPQRSCHTLNITAKTASALEHLKTDVISLIETRTDEVNITDLCYSANARREEYGQYRLSVTGETLGELLTGLRQAQAVPGKAKSKTRKAVFVFSGQGGIHPGMGAELLDTSPHFGPIVQACDGILSAHELPAVLPYLKGELDYYSEFSPQDQIIVSQCACFVLEYALARTWIAWGVVPDLVVGHSLGEYASFAIAGILTLNDSLMLVARRANLMARLCELNGSGMVACRLSAQAVQELVANNPLLHGLEISCKNGPEDTVVAGSGETLVAFMHTCQSIKAKATKMEVSFGFHSAAMDPMLETFRDQLSSLKLSDPIYSVGSSLYGRILSPGESITPEYFAQHARQPVEFCRLGEDMAQTYSEADVTFLEIGPSPATIPKLKAILPRDQASFLLSLSPKESPWKTLSTALQALHLQGWSIIWREVYAGTGASFLEHLPHYPLASVTFVFPFEEETGARREAQKTMTAVIPYEFLDQYTAKDTHEPEFLADMAAIAPFIKAHQVGGVPLCPASVYLEVALEAVGYIDSIGPTSFHVLEDIGFDNPLVYDEANVPDLRMALRQEEFTSRPGYSFTAFSQSRGTHCSGTICYAPDMKIGDLVARKTAYVQRQSHGGFLQDSSPSEIFSTKTIYRTIFPRVVAYSAPLETLKHLKISRSGLEGYGVFQLPPADTQSLFISHPAFIDTMLHATGFIANQQADMDTACICSKIDSIFLPINASQLHSQELDIYCSIVDVGHSIVGDSYVLDKAGNVVSWVEGMSFRKLSLRSFNAHLSRIARPRDASTKTGSGRAKLQTAPSQAQVSTKEASSNPEQTNGVRSPDVRPRLYSVIREICGIQKNQHLAPTTSLEELGVDSLLVMELTHALNDHFSYLGDIQSGVESSKTIQDLESILKGTPEISSSPFDVGLLSTKRASETSSPETVTSPSTPTTSVGSIRLEDVFFEIFGIVIENAERESSLDSLGIDSLGSMELIQELKDRFGISDLEEYGPVSNMSFQDLERIVMNGLDGVTAQVSKQLPSKGATDKIMAESRPAKGAVGFPMILGKHTQNSPPLYMFHDGSGKCSMYSRLEIPGYNTFGIYSVDYDSTKPSIETMEELASMYIDKAGLLSRDQITLGGWSFGGVLAVEAARQLSSRGKKITGLILIDSPAPVSHTPLPNEVIEYISGHKTSKSNAHKNMAAQFKRHAGMLHSYNLSPNSVDIPCVIINCTGTFDTDTLCGVSYPWLSSTEFRKDNLKTWSKIFGKTLPVFDLQCDHFAVFDPRNAEQVSKLVNAACAFLTTA